MIALLLAPVYIIINIYMVHWMFKWMGTCHRHFKGKYFRIVFVIIYTFLATTLLTGFLIKTPLGLHRLLKQISNYWLGAFAYLLMSIAIADLIRFIIKRFKLLKKEVYQARKTFIIAGTIVSLVAGSFTVYGIIHQKRLYTTTYDVTVEKDVEGMDSLKVVLIGDIHLGYSVGEWKVRQMVNRINTLDADVVCIAGDFFDNDYDSVKNPEKIQSILKEIKSTYGVYSCWGNHDLNEPILAGFTFFSDKNKLQDSRMEDFVTESNITMLTDESILVDNKFYLVGREDPELAEKTGYERLTPAELTADLDQEKPIIVISHQPEQLQELADAGVDLDINGHTHDGQVFPGNLTIHLFWENPYGYLKKDDMHNVVTSGVGVWGPNMRVGTKSEVSLINVNFK